MAQETPSKRRLRVLIVAENISLRLSGETLLAAHYLRELLAAGHKVRVLCHIRVRQDLMRDLPADQFRRVTFVADGAWQRAIWRIGRWLPYRVEDLVCNQLIQLLTQLAMRRVARKIVALHAIEVVFQPAPIAAKAVNFMHGLGAPVVIGPMSGGMDLPPAFRFMEKRGVRLAIRGSRWASTLLHWLIPGKRRAAALIVANAQTLDALPSGIVGRVHRLTESAVELARLPLRAELVRRPDDPISFIFCGRFVDWKGIGYLVRAFEPLARESNVRLDLVGDGPLFSEIAAKVRAAKLDDAIMLHGRVPIAKYQTMLRDADVFVTPSLRECGGIAMMEAMAIGLAVIGVDWGGAAQYAGASALLVEPTSVTALVDGLTSAMRRMVRSPELRSSLGMAGRRRIEVDGLDWTTQAHRVAAILADTIDEAEAAPRRAPPAIMQPQPA